MPVDAAFAPYRLGPRLLPEEAASAAALLTAGPLVASATQPLPAALVAAALAEIPSGRAASEAEACRAADGTPSGLGGPPLACLVSDRHRTRVGEAVAGALGAGYAGVSLDRPDAPLAQGLLGAGFCSDCQRELARRLAREYGDQFQPLDYLALAREAVASASGAVSFEALPFGRDFWRFRHESLDQAVRGYARSARDAARAADRPLQVAAWFEALGPAQLRAAHHLDAAVFPAAPASDHAVGLFQLLRASMGRRAVAVAPLPETPPAVLARLVTVGAAFGVGVAGLEPAGAAGAPLARVRALVRAVASEGRAPGAATPVFECAVLYSNEADLWSGGRHRRSVELAVEALAHHHVQAPVVLRVSDAPPGVPVILADAGGLNPLEARELTKRAEAGGHLLVFGEATRVDEAGRRPVPFLPTGRPAGVKAWAGTLAQLATLTPSGGPEVSVDESQLEKALAALLGKGRRALGVTGRTPLVAAAWHGGETIDVHLATLGPDRAQGSTLFLGFHLAGSVRKGRFRSADGTDVPIRLNPSGPSFSTVLPAFSGYAVLSLVG